LGPSGAGKTSLLNTLVGRTSHVMDIEGEISRNDKSIAYIMADDSLHTFLTVQETMELSMKLRCKNGSSYDVHEALEVAKLAVRGWKDLWILNVSIEQIAVWRIYREGRESACALL